MSKLTNDEWKEVEKKATTFFDKAELVCDGYNVTLKMERYRKYKNVITVYVDGKIKGEWIGNVDNEISKKFYYSKKEYLWKPKDRNVSKREKLKLKKVGIDLDANYDFYMPYWSNINSLKRHFIKNCKNIQLKSEVTIGTSETENN